MAKKKIHETTLPTSVMPQANPVPRAASLQQIRDDAVNRQAEHRRSNAEVISELEAWRNEIEATIAFLRAQGK